MLDWAHQKGVKERCEEVTRVQGASQVRCPLFCLMKLVLQRRGKASQRLVRILSPVPVVCFGCRDFRRSGSGALEMCDSPSLRRSCLSYSTSKPDLVNGNYQRFETGVQIRWRAIVTSNNSPVQACCCQSNALVHLFRTWLYHAPTPLVPF